MACVPSDCSIRFDLVYQRFLSLDSDDKGTYSASEALSDLRDADSIAVIVGAGASIDAGLPSWAGLIERLTQSASAQVTKGANGSPAESIPRGADSLALAASARGVLGKVAFERTVVSSLEPRSQSPGEFHRAIARLQLALHERQVRAQRRGSTPQTIVYTTNYDTLLETAIADLADGPDVKVGWHGSSRPARWASWPEAVEPARVSRRQGAITVSHLHGVLRADKLKGLVLTESDYLQQLTDSRTSELIAGSLSSGATLILGASLQDLLLANYMRAAAKSTAAGGVVGRRRRVAVVARQQIYSDVAARLGLATAIRNGTADDADWQRIEAAVTVETAFLTQRWLNYGVKVTFVDYNVETAYFADALALEVRKKDTGTGRTPTTLAVAARDIVERCNAEVNAPSVALAERRTKLKDSPQPPPKQVGWARVLAILLDQAFMAEADFSSTKSLDAFLWLLTPDGQCLSQAASTDRAMFGDRDGPRYRLSSFSRRAAIRSVTRGIAVAEVRRGNDVRWAGVAATPVTLPWPRVDSTDAAPGRTAEPLVDSLQVPIPVGAVSVVTRDPELADLFTTRGPAEDQDAFGRALHAFAETVALVLMRRVGLRTHTPTDVDKARST